VPVPRVYLSNESYPELREVRPRWARSVIWWRAIAFSLRFRRFWGYVAAHVAIAGGFVAAARTVTALEVVGDRSGRSVYGTFALAWLLLFAYLQVSWGGDMMRSYLRAVSTRARRACPDCGHNLTGQLERAGDRVRCPECGAETGREVFAWPYRIPSRYRAFPFWRARGGDP
jgi:DNA-directed RNA polymerase subunit RPC12/RpoP